MRPAVTSDTSGTRCKVNAQVAPYEDANIISLANVSPGEFSCCGAYDYTMGYTDWKHTLLGSIRNSVPDSCCLQETPRCGRDVFTLADLRVVMKKIHTHGCITTLLRRLDSHVVVRFIIIGLCSGCLVYCAFIQLGLVASQFGSSATFPTWTCLSKCLCLSEKFWRKVFSLCSPLEWPVSLHDPNQ